MRIQDLTIQEIAQPVRIEDNDHPLLARLRQSDPTAFDELVLLHQDRVFRLARRLLGWNGEAEEVVQEVFFSAYRQIGQFRQESGLSTWLTQITLNQCRSRQRHRSRWLKWLGKRRPTEPEIAKDAVEQDETSQQVRHAIQQLSPADREVIVLYYLEDRPGKEIAELLQTSAGAIDVRLHRARQKLKVMLTALVENSVDER